MPKDIFQKMNPLWAGLFRKLWEMKADPRDMIYVPDIDWSQLPKVTPENPDKIFFTYEWYEIFRRLSRRIKLVLPLTARGSDVKDILLENAKQLGPVYNFAVMPDSGYTIENVSADLDLNKFVKKGSPWKLMRKADPAIPSGDLIAMPVLGHTFESQKIVMDEVTSGYRGIQKKYKGNINVPMCYINQRFNTTAVVFRCVHGSSESPAFIKDVTDELNSHSDKTIFVFKIEQVMVNGVLEDQGYFDCKAKAQKAVSKGDSITEFIDRSGVVDSKTIMFFVGDSLPDAEGMFGGRAAVFLGKLLKTVNISIGEKLGAPPGMVDLLLVDQENKSRFDLLYEFLNDFIKYCDLYEGTFRPEPVRDTTAITSRKSHAPSDNTVK